MIEIEHVTLTYPDADAPAIRDATLVVPEGELCLVVGRTGSGKSTLLGAIAGLVPHFTGGELRGDVRIDGRSTASSPPRELADLVGYVAQDPLAGFVTDTVEEELAYGMEQLGIAPTVMRKRVEETLDLLGIAELRRRSLRSLSGGQQQRVAIGSVLAVHPKVLVLDEPTSALDPTAAEDVLAAITRLVHDLGVTVVVAEHRLERVVHAADRIVEVRDDGTVRDGDPAEVMATSDVAPPIARLGRLAGWSPLPLSVRDARRLAGDLRRQLGDEPRPSVVAVREVDVTLRSGEVVALMGRNGAGKSSLLWALQGSGKRDAGTVHITTADAPTGVDPTTLRPGDARRHVGLVPQTAADLLYLPTVAAECAQADADAGCPAGTTSALLSRLVADVDPDAHPRDLSEGQRLALVLAVQLAAAPPVVLLDEPTRGLDPHAKAALTTVLRDLAADGHAVMVSTHDVEFVASTADRAVVLADGEVVADGPTAEVLVASPAFAPQVAKILAPARWLTVEQVAAALDGGDR